MKLTASIFLLTFLFFALPARAQDDSAAGATADAVCGFHDMMAGVNGQEENHDAMPEYLALPLEPSAAYLIGLPLDKKATLTMYKDGRVTLDGNDVRDSVERYCAPDNSSEPTPIDPRQESDL
ncbi:MAG: hypothetical protein H6865_07990 [Rhodospirillales bacterium]|nr:hypothetical protein [Alphaproteobacteria bacterium]MCB9987556.1 hypothetical protein [Rhodospirillales bacterium]USO07723.1 MAG: hypothetical protein H6866_00360 [Rhodospirillales bacterium]